MKSVLAWIPSEQAVIKVEEASAVKADYKVYAYAGGRPDPDSVLLGDPVAAGTISIKPEGLYLAVPGLILITYGTARRFEIISPDLEMVFSWYFGGTTGGHWFRRITKTAPEYDSNWDLGYDPDYFSDHSGGIFSIARAESGAGDSIFGDLNHLRKILNEGFKRIGDLTDYGKSLI